MLLWNNKEINVFTPKSPSSLNIKHMQMCKTLNCNAKSQTLETTMKAMQLPPMKDKTNVNPNSPPKRGTRNPKSQTLDHKSLTRGPKYYPCSSLKGGTRSMALSKSSNFTSNRGGASGRGLIAVGKAEQGTRKRRQQ